MEKLLELLKPKSFSIYGYIVAILCAIIGSILFGLTVESRIAEQRHFNCESHSSIKNQYFLEARCFEQYDRHVSLKFFVLVTFSSLVVVSIIYSFSVKSRVYQVEREKVEQACTPDLKKLQPMQLLGTYGVFWYYLTHLVIRIILGSFFVLFQAKYIISFPSQFDCRWDFSKSTTSPKLNATHSNSSLLIDCQTLAARDKTDMAILVFNAHIILAVLVMIETVYLLYKISRDKNFTDDSRFCGTYIYQQRYTRGSRQGYEVSTENLDPLIPPSPGKNDSRTAMDDIYIDPIMYSGRITHEFAKIKNRHELVQAYVEVPESSVRINNLEDLFVSNEKPEKSYNKILVVGRPGIGKSLLCTKIIREWSQGTLLQNTTKSFKYVFLFRFRDLNTKGMARMSLIQFLRCALHSEEIIDNCVFQLLVDKPEEVLLIFDGLDEYKYRNDFVKDESQFRESNGVTDVMPVSALYVKLLQNKLLSGATVVTTTRPHAIDSAELLQFDRDVEILGFTPDKVKSYADKFCKDDPDKSINRIWQHLECNISLLYLCYIPTICNAVCSLLNYYIRGLQAGCHSIVLPITLTDIYKGALRMFIFKHHPDGGKAIHHDFYHDDVFFSPVEEDLAKLGSLAMDGLSEKRMIFEKKEVQGIENCGLLYCLPSKETAPLLGYAAQSSQYCFLHLTLQEFIAARDIVTNMDPEEIADFIKSKAKDTCWYLVIQFIAGLTRGQKFHKVTDCFVETFHDSLSSSKLGDRRLALLMMKCLYELNNENVVKRAASELASRKDFHQDVKLNSLGITAVDCTAIAYVLQHLQSHLNQGDVCLDQLELDYNETLGDSGCSELALLLKEASPKGLHMSECDITDEGIKALFGRVNWEKPCQLTELHLRGNQISDDGVSHLCEALKHDNCNVIELDLRENKMTDEGVLYLGDSLKLENCKLTNLHIGGGNHQITDQGVSCLCEALTRVNCKLHSLDLESDQITYQGVSWLCEALGHKNCTVTDVKVHTLKITDEEKLQSQLNNAIESRASWSSLPLTETYEP